MDIYRLTETPLYKEFKTELQICNIGGLFLGLYRDEKIIEVIIQRLKEDLPDYFIFELRMSDQKVGFPSFFEQSFTQMGSKSNVFHVIGIESLSKELRGNFIDYLQYTRERFKAQPYSIVFWITPQFEKQLFFSAPDFHHWISGTYDFSEVNVDSDQLDEADTNQGIWSLPIENIKKYLEKVVLQYERWQDVKDNNEVFLIEVMERANLNDYYVPSYCIDKNGKEFRLDDLFNEFLADKGRNFLTLLGDFGTGKTSFSLYYYVYLAKQFLNDETKRVPIFISLRNYKGKLDIEEFMKKEFYRKFGIKLSFAIFQELALQGKFVFFVDGFDEMASQADKELTIQNLKELTKLSFENILFMTMKKSELQVANKVFLTCRTHYFLTEIQEREVLKADYTVIYRNYATKSNYEITKIKLKEFNDEQIEEYILKNTRDEEKVSEYMGIIKNTYNLEELSTRPLLLDMIIKTLPGLKDKEKINASQLYKAYTGKWIEREDWRSQMTEEGKRSFMWELALKMYKEGGDFSLHYSKLDKPQETHLKENFEILDDDYFKYEITTCSFLNRDQNGNYKFIHKSFMEYFLAEYFFHRIKNREARIIKPDQLNKETEFFLKLIISAEKSDLKNLDLSYLNLENIDLEAANLYGADLRGANLTKANLWKANIDITKLRDSKLHGAILKEFDLENADLHGFNLQGVNLQGANLQMANFNGAYLNDANLQEANLRGTDLRKAELQWADLQWANLQEANLQMKDLYEANFYGANLKKADLHGAWLQKADFQGAVLQGVNLQKSNLQYTKFQCAILNEAYLQWANLKGAHLQWVDFNGAYITDADFQGANLTGAKNLTFEMLLEVKSLYQVKGLNHEIESRLRKSRPELFEKPEE